MSNRYGARTRLLGAGMNARVSQWFQRSLIKSVQRGTIALTAVASNTATITAVDPNNSVLTYLGGTFDAAAPAEDQAFARLAFTNATTITASRTTATNNVVVSFEVIEYWPGVIKSVQRGLVSVGTATITAVNTAKSNLTSLGFTNDINGDLRCLPMIVLTNGTTITKTFDGGDGSVPVVGYQVVEWF